MRLTIASTMLFAGCYVTAPPQHPTTPQQQYPSSDQTPPAPPLVSEPSLAPPIPQTRAIPSEPVYADVNVGVAGSSVPSVDVFYTELAPYGSWYDDPKYGWVFAPASSAYVPYTNGRWTFTDYGFTWISGDPFGWATDHYGRWVWANRWVWRPDTTWGPAWVQWREGNGYVGWAPGGYSDEANFPVEHWRFVVSPQLFVSNLERHYVAGDIGGILGNSAPVRRYNRSPSGVWVAGPDEDWLRRNRVEWRRERPNLADIGRYNDQQRREAELRARQNQHEWDIRRQRETQVRRDLELQQRRDQEDRRRVTDEQRRIAERQRRQAEEQRRQDEIRNRQLQDQHRQDEIHNRQQQDVDRRNAEAQRRQQAEQQRLADEGRRRQEEEARRRADDDRRRVADQQRRQAEDQSRQDEARKRQDEEQRRRAEADQRRQQDQQHGQDEARKRQDEEQRRRTGEDRRRRDEEARKKSEDDKRGESHKGHGPSR
jgi:hypothetical protein